MVKDKFKWAKEYSKEGYTMFNPSELKSFNAIANKYTNSYLPFFEELLKQHPKDNTTKIILDSLKSIGSIIGAIDLITSGKSLPNPQETINELFTSMEQVEGALIYLTNPNNIASEELKEKIQAAEAGTGENIKELKKSSSVMFGRTKKIKKSGGFLKGAKEAFPELAEEAGEIGKGLLYGLAGPFGGLIHHGITAVGNIKRRMGERQRSLGEKAFAKATITPEMTPEEISAHYSDLMTTGIVDVERIHKQDLAKRGMAPSSNIGQMATTKSISAGKQVKNITGSRSTGYQTLVDFFEGPALRIPYTMRLLTAIEKMAGIEGEGIKDEGATSKAVKGFFGKMGDSIKASLAGLFGGIGTMLVAKFGPLFALLGKAAMMLGQAAAVAGSAWAGWKAGEWLGENVKWGGKNLNEHTQSFFEKHIFKKDKEKDFGLREENSFDQAVTSLRMSLIQRGMNPKEAHKKAVEQIRRARQESTLKIPQTEISIPSTEEMLSPLTNLSEKENIPLDTSINSIQQKYQGEINQLNDVLTQLKNSLLQTGKSVSQKLQSGFDAYDSRDPWTSTLNTGQLSIE